jgi:hypothetical protein
VKRCSACGEERELTEFGRRKDSLEKADKWEETDITEE